MQRRDFLSLGLKAMAVAGATTVLAPLLSRVSVAQDLMNPMKGRAMPAAPSLTTAIGKLELSVDAWQAKLTPEQFRVLRQEGTERAFSSPLNAEKRAGTYHCAGCDLALFGSADKFDSGTGWPSFTQPLYPAVIGTRTDRKLFFARTEVHCARCEGHLGHVFEDGPAPTGLRYCMNGVALRFEAAG
jgi:peptide-methionine (R)-S-oxide reductase